jgi:small subunit ribosomal protein S1
LIQSGAIIDVDGLLTKINKEDMSWKKVFKKKKILKAGEEREFIILSINENDRTVSLGLKQLTEDPWNSVEERYSVEDIVSGEVVTLTNFGVFVEIEEGIEGLINVSNISWTKKNLNPKDMFKKAQLIQVKILEIDKEARKISLGLKQLLPNPWDTIDERFPIGSVHRKRIKKIVNYGIFVELEDDIDGMIHVSDISWDENLKNPTSQYEVDDEIEFQILDIKKNEMKISCGIKQLTPSPWEMIREKYPPRSKVSGIISGIAPFGVFVKLDDGIEGLVHISEVSQKKIDNLEDVFTTKNPVSAIVLGVDVEKKRLSLSIKQYEIISEKEELDRVLNATSPGKVTIGDIIRDKIGE